ncbi:TetR/AcrR family transcriptional regulator [Yinghuangia seranimata]|uniref:TetR/AcrR family transcriptional regulator n=1 Tax=Yinghuangia seranimata TaxID=408067 RepID=UPI00248C926F|nr:TetR/AcrR family transcriptional regulator [Yinghuangia seranimata]MDI2124618.1 TetR/AcrR family transcriptional regulator [Yinghuangia seranimata]
MTPTSAPAPNAARRRESSRRAILTAAFELAGELGYAKLSIEAIAARAGVGKQTIYRWWPTKGAVLIDAFLLLSETEAGDTELPDTGDLEADLKAVLHATVTELNDPRIAEPMRALTVEVATDPALAATYAERLDEPVRELKRHRLRAAQEAGQLVDDVDLDTAIDVIWGPVLNRWLLRTGPLTHAYADSVVETALHSLRPA